MIYNIEITKEEDRFIAKSPELPWLRRFGGSPDDAVRHAKAALFRSLANQVDAGAPIAQEPIGINIVDRVVPEAPLPSAQLPPEVMDRIWKEWKETDGTIKDCVAHIYQVALADAQKLDYQNMFARMNAAVNRAEQAERELAKMEDSRNEFAERERERIAEKNELRAQLAMAKAGLRGAEGALKDRQGTAMKAWKMLEDSVWCRYTVPEATDFIRNNPYPKNG